MSIDSAEKRSRRIPHHPTISFIKEDFEGINKKLNDPMVISIVTANFLVKKFLVDQGSSVDLLYCLVVDCRTPYNAFLGCPSLNNLGAVVSTPHLAIKFPVSDTGVGIVHAD